MGEFEEVTGGIHSALVVNARIGVSSFDEILSTRSIKNAPMA
jgi:hypothetical protein